MFLLNIHLSLQTTGRQIQKDGRLRGRIEKFVAAVKVTSDIPVAVSLLDFKLEAGRSLPTSICWMGYSCTNFEPRPEYQLPREWLALGFRQLNSRMNKLSKNLEFTSNFQVP